MATKKDYYEILGIKKGSTDAEIKAAYRKLAREHHPDMVAESDKADAEKRFKEINEAYQVLSDPQKKQMYDQYGHAGGGFNGASGANGFSGAGTGGQWGPFSYSYSSGGQNINIDPMDIFEEFFGFRGFGGQRQPRKGKNLYYELRIDFVDAVKGLERDINGESGRVTIKVPAGVRDGTELRFAGKGMSGPDGAPNGDLFITVRVSTPKGLQRGGDDIGVVAEIDIVQASLGDTIEVTVVDSSSKNGLGTTKLKIPAGTQPKTQFRLRGKGMPRLRGSGNGDVIVQVEVEIPKRLSRKQKKILEEFRDA